MMVEQAIVIGYQNGVAKVQCYAKSGCGGCSLHSACGTKALSALAGEKSAPQFSLNVDQPLSVGDKIEIGLAEQHFLKSVMWLYAIPLLAILFSTLLLSLWITNEGIVAFGVFVSSWGAFSAIKRILARQQGQLTPIFLRKI